MTQVLGFLLKLSSRVAYGAYTDLTAPAGGALGPLGAEDKLYYTAWFQNPENTSNTADPITVPLEEAISALSVPTDGSVTAVKVWWRQGTGPANLLGYLVDQGGGTWSLSDYDAIPLDELDPHGAAPWEDIQFRGQYVGPEGDAWDSDWVDIVVSHVVPAPTSLPWPPTEAPSGRDGGCVSYPVGLGYALYSHDIGYTDNAGTETIDIRVDVQPPSGTNWADWTANLAEVSDPDTGLWARLDIVSGIIRCTYDMGAGETYAVLWNAGAELVGHGERRQVQFTWSSSTLGVYTRDPVNDALDRLPLRDDTRWTLEASAGDLDNIVEFSQDRVVFGGTWEDAAASTTPTPSFNGTIFGFYVEPDGVAAAEVNHFADHARDPDYGFSDRFGYEFDVALLEGTSAICWSYP